MTSIHYGAGRAQYANSSIRTATWTDPFREMRGRREELEVGRRRPKSKYSQVSSTQSRGTARSMATPLSTSPSIYLRPYNWERTEAKIPPAKQAIDRSYSAPSIRPELPVLSQRSKPRSSHTPPVRNLSIEEVLPNRLASKIYSHIHADSEKKPSLYVIRNTRRAGPAKAPPQLPTVIPFYHLQLEKSISQVLSAEMGAEVDDYIQDLSAEMFPTENRPMTSEKSKLKRNGQPIKSLKDIQVLDKSFNREYKSVDTYNKLLADYHNAQQLRQQKKKDRVNTAIDHRIMSLSQEPSVLMPVATTERSYVRSQSRHHKIQAAAQEAARNRKLTDYVTTRPIREDVSSFPVIIDKVSVTNS